VSANRAHRDFAQLNQIGIALSETRDVEQLLSLILTKAREITGADAGSLYVIEEEGHPAGKSSKAAKESRQLRFKLAQNDSVQFPYGDHTLPITEDSMAGYCALHGEVIELADA
jgi:GAF domain-containing protein